VTGCIFHGGLYVLANRHTDECADPMLCPGCQPCPEPHCDTCERTHAEGTCAMCVGVVRSNLRQVARLMGRLSAEARWGALAFKVGARVPGGDALVMASPGADIEGMHRQLARRLANDLDVSHTYDELRGDVQPPGARLLTWEAQWRKTLGQPTHRPGSPAMARWWLDDRLQAMARHHTFPTFAKAVARLVRQMEDVLHEGERDQVSRVPCLDCGARLVKAYGNTVAEDHHVCPRCGQRYDAGRYQRAKHQHLASKGAERFVAIADAVAAIERPEQTVRAWIRRGLVDTARDPDTKRLLVWWPHVREQHLTAQQRAKPKENAS